MLKLVIPALTIGWIAAVALPSAVMAAPVGLAPLAAPDTGVQEARSMKRRTTMRRQMQRRRTGGVGRMSAPSSAGNARNPSAPVSQQQQGQTSGGPRY